MPSSGTPSQGDIPSGKAAAGSDSPWRFVLEASPALFPNRAGTIESRAERARDGRRAAIRTVGRAEALSTLSAMSRSLRREAGAQVSSSSSDASEEDLLETTRERGSSSELRELLLSKRTSAGGAVGRETGETARRAARLAKPLERSVERALRGERDDADDTDTPSKMTFFNPPSRGSWTRAPANSASGTPSAAPTPSRFSTSLAAQKQRLEDVLSEAEARRRLEVKLQAVEEPPIMATPVQRKYIMRWVDLHRGTLRSVADVALAALKKARTDKAYAARVRAENEIARLARLERIRLQLADFRRSDHRARWKKACDALHFVSYVKHLATLSRKANATAAVRRQRLEREAAERAAAEARGETPVPVRANDTRDVEGASSASGDVARSAGPATDDPISRHDAEKARLASSLRATKKTLETRFDRGASQTDGIGDENKSADDDDGDFGFEPRLGRANAAALATRKATRDMGEKEYRDLSFALKEEEKREALERIGQARREFHWRPVTRVRLAYSLPPELFLDDDEQYDDAVLAAGKTLRDAGVRVLGSRAAAAVGAQGGAEEKSQSLDDAVGNLGGDFDRSFKVKKKTPAAADASVVKAHDASTASRKKKPPEGAAMDEEAARAVALERRRRAERLAAAYDANLAAAHAAPETEKALASFDAEGPATTFGTHAGGGRSRSLGAGAPLPPMRFGVSDASRRRGELFDELLDDDGDVRRLGFAARELPRRREEKAARVKHYGKWYVPARTRSAAAFAESERVWTETRGGAPAAEIKALQARESQLAARHQRSYAAKIYKSWLDARVGENARLPAYMRDVEAQEDRTWWEKSAQERVREENERLARSRTDAGAQMLRFAPQ